MFIRRHVKRRNAVIITVLGGGILIFLEMIARSDREVTQDHYDPRGIYPVQASPEEPVPCIPYQNSLEAQEKSQPYRSNYLLMTLGSHAALLKASQIIPNNNAILVADSAAFIGGQFLDFMEGVTISNRERLKTVALEECSIALLENSIDSYNITKFIVIFDEIDLSQPIQPHLIGDVLKCYVALLDIVAKREHTHLQLWLQYSGTGDSGVQLKRAFKGQPSCYDRIHGDKMHDVLLKSIYLYTTTYERLYKASFEIVIS